MQSLDPSPSVRSAQSILLPEVTTSHVTVTILSSVPGQFSGDQPPVDEIAVSDVVFTAR